MPFYFISYKYSLERLIQELEDSKKPCQSSWAWLALSDHLVGFWP